MTRTVSPEIQTINALCYAAGALNLEQFCALLGWEVDLYAQDKWEDLKKTGRLLGTFDNHVLNTLIEHGRTLA